VKTHAIERADDERINWVASIPFFLVHVACLAALVTGVDARALIMGAVLYVVRVFFITAGYHRYFAHRSYKLGRGMQFVMAFGGATAVQKSALWWASHHRNHHRYSDTDLDVHSPQKGFWWSHAGWILCNKTKAYDPALIRDFDKFPELRFLHRHDWIGPWALGIACFLIGGWSGLVVGFVWSTVLCWHATFTVNSLAHVFGRRRYATGDTSRNSAVIALITLGEGWHNNHHHHQASARQGFFWWEYDVTYYVLKGLSWVGLVRDLRVPSASILAGGRVRDGAFDMGMFKAHWAKASAALAASHLPGLALRGSSASDEISGPTATTVDPVHAIDATDAVDAVDAVDEERVSRRDALEELIRDRTTSLQDYVHHSLRSAEELASLSRRLQRSANTTE
jgi:stearoyl-CoA desaturase (delta-9 desaturase)